MKLKRILEEFSYAISSNLISLAVSSLAVLIAPRFITVQQYGLWQLYIFYTSYVGVLHFGWLDGIYLRYGGKEYSQLDKELFFSQFIQLTFSQLIIGTGIALLAFFQSNSQQVIITIATAIATVMINLVQFFLLILQDTSRIKEYAIVTSLGRVSYFAGTVLLLLCGLRKFQWLVFADLAGRFISLIYSMYACRDIVFRKISSFNFTFLETWINLSVGVKLLLANVSSSLIIGVVKYGIQWHWGIRKFGEVSLTLNISNLLMVFISAISLVLYPTLKRVRKDRLHLLYISIRDVLMFTMLIGLIIYYPISLFLPVWLPKYQSSLHFMALLFPMCVFSGKFSLLITTFFNTYRLEKSLMFVNGATLIISVIITLINVLVVNDITITMISIVFILWIQSSLGEIVLARKIHLLVGCKLFFETIVVIAFMTLNWFFPVTIAFSLYIVVLFIYYIANRLDLASGLKALINHY